MMVRRGDGRGQSLVEFAIVLPIFVLVVIGLFDGALAVYNYSTVSNAAREGARVAMVDQDAAVVETAIRAHAVALRGDRLTVTQTPCSTFGCQYTVRVDYVYEPIFLGAFFRPTITSTVAMSVETPNP